MDTETRDAIKEMRDAYKKVRDVNRLLRRQIVELKAQIVKVRADHDWLRAQAITTAIISDECRVVALEGMAGAQYACAAAINKSAIQKFHDELLPGRIGVLGKIFDERVTEKARLHGVSLVPVEGTGK